MVFFSKYGQREKILFTEHDSQNSKEFILYQYPTNARLPLLLQVFLKLSKDCPNHFAHKTDPVK